MIVLSIVLFPSIISVNRTRAAQAAIIFGPSAAERGKYVPILTYMAKLVRRRNRQKERMCPGMRVMSSPRSTTSKRVSDFRHNSKSPTSLTNRPHRSPPGTCSTRTSTDSPPGSRDYSHHFIYVHPKVDRWASLLTLNQKANR
ncbi:hypothetical protein ElyMa_006668800 [Elysia marginata]|uniref:Secreted protein n=1 Tax=Elysia marginata TaxID=1093978 RepID=A0AAV4IRK2_9GAST|nr:hypothetical protein ElyMa_006668800 [Elysia marginata]